MSMGVYLSEILYQFITRPPVVKITFAKILLKSLRQAQLVDLTNILKTAIAHSGAKTS
jgi:hypothetical protein